jgi:protein-L-isoaspartate(D-aspartate) O-methyltransferase
LCPEGGIVATGEQLAGWLGGPGQTPRGSRRCLAFCRTLPQNPVAILRRRDGQGLGSRRLDMVDFRTARRAMVDGQVRTNDVTHLGLIAAMLEVPREAFVPETRAALAYLDRDVPIADATAKEPARYLIKPMVLARLIQAAEPTPQDRVLVVGAGSGYAAAVLSRLAASVVVLEQNESLVQQARSILPGLGFANITVLDGPLVAGAPGSGPYDLILIDGGVETVPEGLFGQLATHGRLVTVVAAGPVGKATLFQTVSRETCGRVLFDASAPLLPGFAKAPAFVF